ncbi:hypothetical protein JW758_01830 [Candidatus Peregrinibacteria bacterium]|nr:hypothetical protein [Candidatus Peregrinibacteria bacterium]
MSGENKFKSLKVIIKNKALRIFGILSVTFLIFSIIFAYLAYSFNDRIEKNNVEMEVVQKKLSDLQYLVNIQTEEDDIILEKKSFASFQEVVPFITFLESLFSIIDPTTSITIRSDEKQISKDHFADYQITVKIGSKKELFFKALDELYNTQFITKLTNFTMNYRPLEESGENVLYEVKFDVRLYLN